MTLKQRKAIANVVGNGGNVTKAMIDAGYSVATANTPQKLTQSDAWKELMEKYLPDELLTQKTIEGLEAVKQLATRVIFKKEAPTSQSAGELPLADSRTDDFIEVPDMPTRHKYLETAYKLKGRFVEKNEIDGTLEVIVRRGE